MNFSFSFAKYPSLLVFLGISFFVPIATFASTLVLSPQNVSVHVGETFSVSVHADPLGSKNYTVKADIAFTPGIVSLDTWKFADIWTVLRQPGYDSFSNTLGTLIRTGGYPGGFGSKVLFGTATFRAIKEGKATLLVTPKSFVYDGANQNSYTEANKVTITVLPAEPKKVVVEEIKSSVDHTFDIALVLSKNEVLPGEILSSVVHVTNLSSLIEKIRVPIHYMLIGVEGAVLFEDTSPVELTGRNLKFDYDIAIPSNLVPGTYTLVARVEYENMTEPVESRGIFRVGDEPVLFDVSSENARDEGTFPIILVSVILFAGILLGVSVALVFEHLRKKRIYRKFKKRHG